MTSVTFDTVPHCRLLNKLCHYETHDWIKVWLTHNQRAQHIVLNGYMTQISIRRSPQGTVLQQQMFLLYMILMKSTMLSHLSYDFLQMIASYVY